MDSHDVTGIACWCEPLVQQVCPGCDHLTDMVGKKRPGCMDCNWTGLVPKFDDEGPFLVVHRVNVSKERGEMVKHQQSDPEPKKAIVCPFKRCLGKPMKLGLCSIEGERIQKYFVYCKGCGASGPEMNNETEAVEAWNDRRPPEPLPLPRNPYGAKLGLLFVILSLLTG